MRVPTRLLLPATAALALAAALPAHAAESYDNCTGFIDSLPAVIGEQGVWCLRADLSTNMESGEAIRIGTNNVTIDCNHFKIGNLQASEQNTASGVYADIRNSVVVRHCNVRGFGVGISLLGEGQRVEANRVLLARDIGIYVNGSRNVVVGNHVIDTAGFSLPIGIQAVGNADVVDNIVDSVVAQSGSAVGIRLSDHISSVVRGNTVRGIFAATAGRGIDVTDTTSRALVQGNYVEGAPVPGSVGLDCSDTDIVARDNTVLGFETPLGCADRGGNVVD